MSGCFYTGSGIVMEAGDIDTFGCVGSWVAWRNGPLLLQKRNSQNKVQNKQSK